MFKKIILLPVLLCALAACNTVTTDQGDLRSHLHQTLNVHDRIGVLSLVDNKIMLGNTPVSKQNKDAKIIDKPALKLPHATTDTLARLLQKNSFSKVTAYQLTDQQRSKLRKLFSQRLGLFDNAQTLLNDKIRHLLCEKNLCRGIRYYIVLLPQNLHATTTVRKSYDMSQFHIPYRLILLDAKNMHVIAVDTADCIGEIFRVYAYLESSRTVLEQHNAIDVIASLETSLNDLLTPLPENGF